MRGLLVACVAADPAKEFASCSAMVGSFEDYTTRVSVFQPKVYLATPHSTQHAHGNVTSSTDCTCSGLITFYDGKPYMFKYDLWSCELTWSSAPSSSQPMPSELNVWSRDGPCFGPPRCDPSKTDELLVSMSLAEAVAAATKAQEAANAALPVAEKMVEVVSAFTELFPANAEGHAAQRNAEKAVQSVQSALLLAQDALNGTAPGAVAAGPTATPGNPQPLENTPVNQAHISGGSAAMSAAHAASALLQQSKSGARRMLRKGKDPFEAKMASGCDALSGEFEQGSAVIEVHDGIAYAVNGQGVHAKGEVTGESPCTCSGEMDYGEDLGVFQFKYNLELCTLTWSSPPTLEVPHFVEVNTWKKDGSGCPTTRQCTQMTPQPQAVQVHNSAEIGMKAEIAAIKVASALSFVAMAGQTVSTEAVKEAGRHEDSKDKCAEAVTSVVGVLETVEAPARAAFAVLSGINPRAVGPARSAIQTALHVLGMAKKHAESLK